MTSVRVAWLLVVILPISVALSCGSSSKPPADAGVALDGGTSLDGGAVDGGVPSENEPLDSRTNDTVATAQFITLGETVSGTIGNHIAPDNDDRDVYRFSSQIHEVFEVTLTAPSGSDLQVDFGVADGVGDYQRIGLAGATPSSTTRQFFTTLGGDLFVVVNDARNIGFPSGHVGGATYTYELTVRKATPNVTPVTLPLIAHAAAIDAQGRLAVFSFQGTAGQQVRAETRAMRLNPPSDLDTWLLLMDMTSSSTPSLLAHNDDIETGVRRDSYLEATLSNTGLHYVIVDYWGIEGPAQNFEIDIYAPTVDGGVADGGAADGGTADGG